MASFYVSGLATNMQDFASFLPKYAFLAWALASGILCGDGNGTQLVCEKSKAFETVESVVSFQFR